MTLVKSQSVSIEAQPSNILGFLEWLASRSPNEYMSLFSGTGQSAEKETMMYRTIRAMVENYHADGRLSSKVALSPDHAGLVDNSRAFKWLVDCQYFAVDGDRCTLTQLAIAKLYVHFADSLENGSPIAITPALYQQTHSKL